MALRPLKVWTTNDFEGRWPVGSAAVVVADCKECAMDLMEGALLSAKLTTTGFTLVEIDITTPQVRILCDGDY